MAFEDLKIFKLNRIKYNELWDDAVKWIKDCYNYTEEQFTLASPFYQLLTVILHLGRMIFYYIEDSITGLNIRTAYRPDQIKGLATLTGHRPCRATAARGAVKLTYKDNGNMNLNGQICYIPNKTQITSYINGCQYVLLFGADTAKMTMSAGNYLDCTIVQGKIKYQTVTGTGEPLQSFNFSEKNFAEIDEYFVNVYVNGTSWQTVTSIVDAGYNQPCVVIKTAQTTGIDIFFGNGDMGAIPPQGSVILVEYVVTDGVIGNLAQENAGKPEAWKIEGVGYLPNNTSFQLDECFSITATTDVIFGASSEDISLTQRLAPYASRAMVLANEVNYICFFKRMNLFSTVEIIKGYATRESNSNAIIQQNQAYSAYQKALDEWAASVDMEGESSYNSQELYKVVEKTLADYQAASVRADNTYYLDNTVYILLIPDINKRMSSTSNYFTCDESLFQMSKAEQDNVLDFIETSGQRIITVENRLISPKIVRFAINAQVKLWNNYSAESVYSDCLTRISNYLCSYVRKDILPVSDIIGILENVEGIDSVKVWFDADQENEKVYGPNNYGIDAYGDVILYRTYNDYYGNNVQVRDLLPLFRGGFTSPEGIEYSSQQSNNWTSAFNMNVVGTTTTSRLQIEKYTALT